MSHLRPVLLTFVATFAIVSAASGQSTSAQCTLTFDAIWSAATHPVDFPGALAHFSPLIGATHNDQVVFWQPGDFASAGIQLVAETGNPATFNNEIQTEIVAGFAAEVISGGGIGVSPGSVSTSFDIDLSHPLVTVITMIAPSPDWFIGVHDEPLFENGAWAAEKVFELPPYDSGTDSGSTFLSDDLATIPADPISLLSDPPLEGAPSFGTFTFECTSDLLFLDGFESGGLGSWSSSSGG